MICPYCGKEMRYGVIQSQHEINWKPKKESFLQLLDLVRMRLFCLSFLF